MPALLETQRRVMDSLLQRGDPADAAALLRPTPGLDAARRLQLHRNNLFESLTAALAAVYPVTLQLVGEAFFRAMARRFIPQFPSRSGNLHAFGAELPDFIRGFEPAAAVPYLPDMAALEWALHAVYHAAPQPALDLPALAALDAGRQAALTLQLQPCARLLASSFPVLPLWQAHQGGAAGGLDAIDWREGARLLVAQRALEVEFQRLGAGELAWLRALDAGEPLGAACGLALEAEAGFDLPAVLLRHLELGTFRALDCEGDTP
ncbi:HvfC/BufC N-terminal domain-containing protein [Azohydromonas aeria]|uniref:HvfC/BufC N-terminal domain-containing protein n=1 Tax=Azohydromonas aeria TaxID=2590212 RepID=UPI0012FA70C8|nr:DNA-binding domain-containing protein [Azohydromonas aeria]